MISAVLDTNTLVSGLGWPGGTPGRVVDAAVAGRFLLITSPALLDELRRVLAYPKLAELCCDPGSLVDLVAEVASVVNPQITLHAIADDADNRVLEAAVTAQADVIVTGDHDLLALDSYGDILILTPAEFTKLIEDDEPSSFS